jgi:hypothetical protein
MESSTGQMVPIMKDNGTIIRPRGKVHSGMQKVMYIWANSKMTWLMDMVSTPISTEVSTKESSRMTSKKVMERRNGSMEQNTSVHTRME